MSQRKELIDRAGQPGANFSAICRELGISRKTGYKWLKRASANGPDGLVDQSRRPGHSPNQTEAAMEAQVLAVRAESPEWGGRKIRRVLQDQGLAQVPAASTITEILRRHAHIDQQEAQKHKPWQRFARERPNELWQMDFKGDCALTEGGRCHPLTVIDDHSRFLVGLKACGDETQSTVRHQLEAIFGQYGLPEAMLMDNGSAWRDGPSGYTRFSAWLMRLEIRVLHGRPYHPQTQGKDERLHRTLLAEVLRHTALATLDQAQHCFDHWQQRYNTIRPHEALQLDTPAQHYQPSPRPFPAVLPPICYQPGDAVRKIDKNGHLYFAGRKFRVGKGFIGEPLAVRPTEVDGQFHVFYCKSIVALIDLLADNC